MLSKWDFGDQPKYTAGRDMTQIKEINELIVRYSANSTRAVLMRVSSSFNEIVPPYLYQDIKLTRRSSYQFFKGSTKDANAEGRKIEYCEYVKSIIFLDIPSPQFIFFTKKLYQDLKDMYMTSLIFPRVQKVSFSASTMTELTDYRDKYNLPHAFLELLPRLIQPRQLCITYPVFTSGDCANFLLSRLDKDNDYPCDRITQSDEAMKYFADFRDLKIPREVRNLFSFLSELDTLYSVTLHQVGTNSELPCTVPVSKVFFRTCDCHMQDYIYSNGVEGCYSHTTSQGRRKQLASLPKDFQDEREYRLRHGLNGIKQRIKLINPILWNDSRNSRERLHKLISVQAKGWEEERIEMIGWDQAEECGCCHTKEGY